jgi:hypothetical protein
MDRTPKGLKKMCKLTYEEMPSKARVGIQLTRKTVVSNENSKDF